MNDLVYCRTHINYANDSDVSPVEVDIHNGRVLPRTHGWERCGFELMDHHSAVKNWHSADEIQAIYYDEIASFAERISGCSYALVSGHISRNPEQAKLHEDYGPITFVHSDFTESYGELIKDFYSGDRNEAQMGLDRAGISSDQVAAATRVLILQFWRNVGSREMDFPLALCDTETVSRDELRSFHVSNYAGGDFSFDTFGVVAPAEGGKHRWYTFPQMTQDEVVVFRTYDSLRVERSEPFWTPHSAFRDPNVPSGGPSRSSIEIRATCLFS